MGVVESLEVIDIDHDERQDVIRTPRAAPFQVKRLVEGASVGDAGQPIDLAEPFEQVTLTLEFQMRFHAQLDDGFLEGLGDVIDRAQRQSADLVLGIGKRGDEDDRDRGQPGIGLERSKRLVAVHAGHHDIEQDQIRRRGSGQLERLRAAGGGRDRVSRIDDHPAQNADVVRNVIDNQYSHRKSRSLRPSSALSGILL